jgi:hypothetical protein
VALQISSPGIIANDNTPKNTTPAIPPSSGAPTAANSVSPTR